MKGVTESMAGRAALLQLMPLSTAETSKVTMFRGGFPEVLLRLSFRSLWFRSYLQTYLERDVRAISSIRDLATFHRFLALPASRGGHILNKTDLAAPLGVSVHAITEWLNILEIARLAQATGRHAVEGYVVHQPAATASVTTALLPGVKAVGPADLLEALARR